MRAQFLLWCLLLPLALLAGEEPEPMVARPAAVVITPQPQAKAVDTQKAKLVVPPAGEIAPYAAKYEVRYGGLKVGEMTQQLTERMNGQQTLQTVAYTTGVVSWLKNDTITERSIWRDEAGVMLPLSYTYRYSGRSKDVFERLDFDWQAGIVKSLRDGKVTELAVERGILDKHMHQLLLRRELACGGRHFSYRVADRSKLKDHEYEVVGEEQVQTKALGNLDCLKVVKGDTIFWVARELDYLPVRIEKDEGGTLATSKIIEYQGH